jgi:hypothetical protein
MKPTQLVGLLVGVGGGVTVEEEYDIRPGDVLVSKPSAMFGGGCAVRYGKGHREGVVPTSGIVEQTASHAQSQRALG